MKIKKNTIALIMGSLLPVLTASAGVPTDTYYIYNRTSGLNLAPSGGGTANGTKIVQGSFGGSTNTTQQWRVTALATAGQYNIVSVLSNRAAEVPAGSTSNGVNCDIWDYGGGNHQKVTMTSTGLGMFSLVFVHSGKVMNVNGGSTASGANIVQFNNDGSWNSQWRFHSVASRVVPQSGTTWMAKFLGNQSATRSTHYDLIFDGDSITDFWKSNGLSVWNANWAPKGAYDYGISGDRTEHLYWRLQQDEADAVNPKLVVLLIGTNNTGGDDAATIASKITTIVNEYLIHCPNAHILLMGIFPRGSQPNTPIRNLIADVNSRISSLNGTGGGRVIYKDIGSKFLQADGTISSSIMSDYLHPTAAGYQIWADNIKTIVNQYVP